MNGQAESGRGAGWVVVQFVLLWLLIALVAGSPGEWGGALSTIGGLLMIVIGLALVGLSALKLGDKFSVFPRPKADGTLIQTGLYGVVRHPVYAGVILSAGGAALLRTSVPGLLLTLLLIVFFDRKAALEERWLLAKFPDYAAYRTRVRKLIPLIY